MFPFKKILCPTDFSEASLAGLRMASEMADNFDTEIILLNVHKPIPHLPTPRLEASEVTFDISAYEKHVAEDALENLATVADAALSDNVEPSLVVRMGQPAQEILKLAAEENVDAIVIATHGYTGIKHVVFGSVAQRVVRRAKCTVVTVQAG